MANDKPDLTAVEFFGALEAMSLAMPEVTHLNRHPFSGILTRIDEPSDGAPGGSGGRRVYVTKGCAERALPTLLGMAVDCRSDFKDHEVANKIGVITSADIDGNAIVIAGHFFSKDFPETMRKILKEKAKLGFSYELTPTDAAITADNLLRIEDGIFTGAALLYKDKAAYKSTSLAASDSQEKAMEKELKDLIEAVAAITASQKTLSDGLAAVTALVTTQVSASGGDLSASASCRAAVEPHAAGLEAAADKMHAAGIGGHASMGHVAVLRSMAGHLRASAALGKMPHIFRDHDLLSADAGQQQQHQPQGGVMDAETKKQFEALTASVSKINDSLAGVTTKLADLSAAQAAATTRDQPTRKTIPSNVASLLARHGLTAGDDLSAINLTDIGTKLKAAGMDPENIMVVKNTIDRAQRGLPA